jgi:hypothetical protein
VQLCLGLRRKRWLYFPQGTREKKGNDKVLATTKHQFCSRECREDRSRKTREKHNQQPEGKKRGKSVQEYVCLVHTHTQPRTQTHTSHIHAHTHLIISLLSARRYDLCVISRQYSRLDPQQQLTVLHTAPGMQDSSHIFTIVTCSLSRSLPV